MSSAKFVNIATLMTSCNLEVEEFPDNLKCSQYRLVLKDAYNVPCGCTFCRICIDDIMSNGSQFCPGVSGDCAETLLSTAAPNYSANKSISKLTVKCTSNDYVYKCQLVEMGEHLLECQRKSVECPFQQFGCNQENMTDNGMDEYMQKDPVSHVGALIEMIGNIKSETEDNRREIDILTQIQNDNEELIEMLKSQLVLEDGQIITLIDQMVYVENESKSIQNQIKAIEDEKAGLADQFQILSEKIDREIDERKKSDELDSAKVLKYVDKKITAIKKVIGSNKKKLATDMKSLRDNIQSIEDNIEDITAQIQWIKAVMGLDRVNARHEWVIDENVGKTSWHRTIEMSSHFTGAVHPYKYQLSCANGYTDHSLRVYLCIEPGPDEDQLALPFKCGLIISVADMNRYDKSRIVYRLCLIEKRNYNSWNESDLFEFPHYKLRRAGLSLDRGVRVSCVIPLDADQLHGFHAHNQHNEVHIIEEYQLFRDINHEYF